MKALTDEWSNTYAATQMSATQLDIVEQVKYINELEKERPGI